MAHLSGPIRSGVAFQVAKSEVNAFTKIDEALKAAETLSAEQSMLLTNAMGFLAMGKPEYLPELKRLVENKRLFFLRATSIPGVIEKAGERPNGAEDAFTASIVTLNPKTGKRSGMHVTFFDQKFVAGQTAKLGQLYVVAVHELVHALRAERGERAPTRRAEEVATFTESNAIAEKTVAQLKQLIADPKTAQRSKQFFLKVSKEIEDQLRVDKKMLQSWQAKPLMVR